MTYPFEALPTTPIDDEYYCQKDKIFVMSNGVNPACPTCGQTMVVALRSIMDGSRITGNDELAKRTSGTTRGTGKS